MQLSLRSSRWGIAPPVPRSFTLLATGEAAVAPYVQFEWITPLVTTHVTSVLTHLPVVILCLTEDTQIFTSASYICYHTPVAFHPWHLYCESVIWGRVTASLSLQLLLNSPDAVQSWNVM